MNAIFRIIFNAAWGEWLHLYRSPLFVALAIIQAVTLIFLVSLFGITGALAPTAVIDDDGGPYARQFIHHLQTAHHSFALRFDMSESAAEKALRQGRLVAIITIPAGFSYGIEYRKAQVIKVDVNNINTDMTEDIQRALPSAIVAFGNDIHAPEIRLQAREHDLIPHDTGFIPYLVVSALVLATLVIAGILAAMVVAREFEWAPRRCCGLAGAVSPPPASSLSPPCSSRYGPSVPAAAVWLRLSRDAALPPAPGGCAAGVHRHFQLSGRGPRCTHPAHAAGHLVDLRPGAPLVFHQWLL